MIPTSRSRALADAQRIKTLGAHVVMDDFGTGYRSSPTCGRSIRKIKIFDGFFHQGGERQRTGRRPIVRAR